MTPQTTYTSLIEEVDKVLSLVRAFWMEARDPGEKTKHRVRLDELLDQRFALMVKRDAANTPSTT